MTRRTPPPTEPRRVQDRGDREIDALVRAASARDAHEGEIFVAVIDKIDARERRPVMRLPRLSPGFAATGFAAMLLASGLAGYELAGPGVTDGDILRLAFGDPAALDAAILGTGSGPAGGNE